MAYTAYSKDEIAKQSKELLKAYHRIVNGQPLHIPIGSPITKKNVVLEARLPYGVLNRSNKQTLELNLQISQDVKKRRSSLIKIRIAERNAKKAA